MATAPPRGVSLFVVAVKAELHHRLALSVTCSICCRETSVAENCELRFWIPPLWDCSIQSYLADLQIGVPYIKALYILVVAACLLLPPLAITHSCWRCLGREHR